MSDFEFEVRLVERDKTGKPRLNSNGNPIYRSFESNDGNKIYDFFMKYSGNRKQKKKKPAK